MLISLDSNAEIAAFETSVRAFAGFKKGGQQMKVVAEKTWSERSQNTLGMSLGGYVAGASVET